MADPFTISVLFASITAAGGFVLSLLGWELFRGAPFGRLMGLLAVLLFGLMVYHAVLIVVGRESVLVLESAAFTGLLAWVGLALRQHRRLARRPRGERP